MISVVLTIRYGEHPLGTPRAWYLPGPGPDQWLAEICRCSVPHKELRLLPVPRSRTDRRAQGVLIVPPEQDLAGVSKRCVPFAQAGGRLFLPLVARLEPALTERELQSCLSTEFLYVWHPACGLIAFEKDEVLSVGDLLDVAPPSDRLWNRAETGMVFSRRLLSISPEQTLTPEQIFEEGQDGIGAESDDLKSLPRSPHEPTKGLLAGLGRMGTQSLARAAQWFADHTPATAGKRTWVNDLGDWAGSHLAKIAEGMTAARHKEIARLLHLLNTDPDRGLRFALPLGGGGYRGRALPGNRLGEHGVDFQLGAIRRGGPADIWNLPGEYLNRLTARYRELANREIHLGRHRRAAYIFAHLLGDHQAAANALVAGRHWREAATVYRKWLNRPQNAAKCLEEGGLWTEAIALYQELGSHEKVGDLYRDLGQEEDAVKAYRTAVADKRKRQDFLEAARLLELKLAAPDEALETLSLGWPSSSQAGRCLREVFRIHGRFGRHHECHGWIERLRREHHRSEADVLAAEMLSDVATVYPDQGVKERAADSARVIVSRQLAAATSSEQRRMLAAIAGLAPQDRLLARDCLRYRQPPPRTALTPVRRQATLPSLRPIHTISLPQGLPWQAAVASGKAIYAASVTDRTAIVVRSGWRQPCLPAAGWTLEKPVDQPVLLLSAAPHGDTHVVFHVLGQPPLAKVETLGPNDTFAEPVVVGPTEALSDRTLAAVRVGGGVTWIAEPRGGQLCLIAVGPGGQTLSTEVIPDATWPHWFVWDEEHADPDCFRGALHARTNRVYLGLGSRIMILDRSKTPEFMELSRPIHQLVGSAPHTRPRIAATFQRGGEVFWDDFEPANASPFATEMERPLACFNRAGYLIAACEGCCQVYSTQDRRLQWKAEVSLSGPRPIAILGSPRNDQFGLFTPKGEILVYEIPR